MTLEELPDFYKWAGSFPGKTCNFKKSPRSSKELLEKGFKNVKGGFFV